MLVQLTSSQSSDLQILAARLLSSISHGSAHRTVPVATASAAPRLVQLMRSDSGDLQARAAAALLSLSNPMLSTDEARAAVAAAGAMPLAIFSAWTALMHRLC